MRLITDTSLHGAVMKITCSKGIHFHSYEPMSAWRCWVTSLAALHLILSDCNAEVKQVPHGFQPDQWSEMRRSTSCQNKEFDWLERLIKWFFCWSQLWKKGFGCLVPSLADLLRAYYYRKYQSKILFVIVIYWCVGECEWKLSCGIIFIGNSWLGLIHLFL